MASIADNQRYNGFNRQSMAYHNGSNAYNTQYGGRSHGVNGYGMQHAHNDMGSLTHTFGGMGLQNSTYGAQAKTAMGPAAASHMSGMPTNANMHPAVYGSSMQYGYPAYTTGPAQTAGMYTPQGPQYMSQMSYPAYHHENSPISHHWTPTTTTGADLPTLIAPRRDSVSSNENDLPTTPSYANYGNVPHGGVAINRSPSGVYTHSTPSPTSLNYGMHVGKQMEQMDASPRLKMLVSMEPAIPRAIPAPSSPLKPLDRALENQRGETNVYIRGLLPETTDEILEVWGKRFGDIKSSKSIIDMNTGMCKGFGFVKYHNYDDAENCIRGFHFLGYEVSFARESFYSKLKTFSDEHNTNLYVSNLPKTMNEHELGNFFAPHKVCSARILRDKNGHGRGVGFARFEDRNACEEVIKSFNNRTVEDNDNLQIQIRYADTQEQKALKQQTHAARQFRSAEYEYATQAWRQGRIPSAGSTDHEVKAGSVHDLDHYLNAAGAPTQTQRWGHGTNKTLPGRSPLSGIPYTNTYPQSKSQNDDETKSSASDQGVIVNEDAVGGASPAATNASAAQQD